MEHRRRQNYYISEMREQSKLFHHQYGFIILAGISAAMLHARRCKYRR